MKFVYTNIDGSLSIVHPCSKAEIEKNLGHALSDDEYKKHVIERSTPKGAVLHDIDAKQIPIVREWRYAWKHDVDNKQIVIDTVKAKECMLDVSRFKILELNKKFQEALILDGDTSDLKSKLEEAQKCYATLKGLQVKPGIAVDADLSMMKSIVADNLGDVNAASKVKV